MKTYIIRFFFLNDEHASQEVRASNEVSALAVAIHNLGGAYPEWCTDSDFNISIYRK